MIFKITKQEVKKEMPSSTEMLKNLAKTAMSIATKAAMGSAVMTDDLTLENRKSICESCNFRDPEKDRCRLCGCYLSVKQRFAATVCPAKKW